VALEVRRFVKREIGELIDSREPQLLAGIVSDFRLVNGQRGRLAIFKLDDKSGQMEAVVDEELYQAHRDLIRDDELVVVMARIQPGRNGFEPRLNINQVWSLPAARCRFGKYLRVAVNGKAPDIRAVLRDFPPRRESSDQGELVRGLGVRLALLRDEAVAELQLGDDARFYPSDAAIASWIAQADRGQAQIVYE